jgi:hypothetical protein
MAALKTRPAMVAAVMTSVFIGFSLNGGSISLMLRLQRPSALWLDHVRWRDKSMEMQDGAASPLLQQDAPSRSRGAIAPELFHQMALLKTRAQGMPGAGRTHGPPATKKQAAVTTGSAETSRHSLRDGFNGVLRALPGDHAWLPPSVAGLIEDSLSTCDFSACFGAPEPHDFSVRVTLAFVLRNLRVHRIPRPTFVTIAKRPSCERRMRG